jgi:hypothetical protein
MRIPVNLASQPLRRDRAVCLLGYLRSVARDN